MPEVFLTGGTGFIGGALLRRLVGEGREVRALVRTVAAADAIRAAGAEPVRGDLLDEESLVSGAAGCSTVFHVAGLNAACLYRPAQLERVNVAGTTAVVRAAARAGTSRVIFTSSATTIGEEAGVVGTEATPHRGTYLTVYERSKHLAELAGQAEARRVEVPFVSVNPSSVQGPGRTGGTARILIAYLRGRLRFAVDSPVSLVFIDDVVAVHLEAERQGVSGERYLVSGWATSIREAVALLTAVSGVERRVRYLPAWTLSAVATAAGGLWKALRRDAPLCREMVRALRHGHAYDASRIEREWGVRYTPPEQWLRTTVEWYRDQGIV